MRILHEVVGDAGRGEVAFVPAFDEEPTFVFEIVDVDGYKIRQRSRCDACFHAPAVSFIIPRWSFIWDLVRIWVTASATSDRRLTRSTGPGSPSSAQPPFMK